MIVPSHGKPGLFMNVVARAARSLSDKEARRFERRRGHVSLRSSNLPQATQSGRLLGGRSRWS